MQVVQTYAPAELKVKFDDCACLSLSAAAMSAAKHALQTLEALPTIADLTAQLAGAKPEIH